MNRLLRTGKLPIKELLIVGFLVGLLSVNIEKSTLQSTTGFLNENILCSMKNQTVDSGALFFFLMRHRLGVEVFILLGATTYLGVYLCAGEIFCFGMQLGYFVETAILRYGLKGIALIFLAVFPQVFLYIPAYAGIVLLGEEICRELYYHRIYLPMARTEEGFTEKMWRFVTQKSKILCLILCTIAICGGCYLESYCNPPIFLSFLRIF